MKQLTKRKNLTKRKKALIIAELERNGNNVTKTAKLLGVSRQTIYNLRSDEVALEVSQKIEETITDVIETVRVEHMDIATSAYEVKMLCLKRLKQLIPIQTNVFMVAAALKAVTEITGEKEPETNPILSFYKKTTETLRQKGYGTQRSITQGDESQPAGSE